MKEPLVSVIMPTYNDGRYLITAIESILKQTYKNIELILINDGCTDNTDNIVKGLNDTRIRYYINDKNRGYIFSLNKGIDLAKGKYIARMDADDYCPLDRFNKQIYYLENNPQVDVLGGSMIAFENNTNKKRLCKFPKKHNEIKSRLFFRNAMSHPTVVLKSQILKTSKIQYNSNYFAAEDYKLWVDLIKTARFHNLIDPLLCYRVHPKSTSNNKRQEQLVTVNKIQEELLIELIPNLKDEEIKFHLKILNERYYSNINVRELAQWCNYLIKTNNKVLLYNSSSYKKEMSNLIFDHIINKKSYNPKEISFLYYKPYFLFRHPLISLKFVIKCFLNKTEKL